MIKVSGVSRLIVETPGTECGVAQCMKAIVQKTEL